MNRPKQPCLTLFWPQELFLCRNPLFHQHFKLNFCNVAFPGEMHFKVKPILQMVKTEGFIYTIHTYFFQPSLYRFDFTFSVIMVFVWRLPTLKEALESY